MDADTFLKNFTVTVSKYEACDASHVVIGYIVLCDMNSRSMYIETYAPCPPDATQNQIMNTGWSYIWEVVQSWAGVITAQCAGME